MSKSVARIDPSDDPEYQRLLELISATYVAEQRSQQEEPS